MKKQLFFLTAFSFFLLIFFQANLTAQSLSPERVEKIKSATVRITIENSASMGTGFFVSNDGTLFTCWHVIEPALNRDSLRRIISGKKIYGELNTGEKLEFQILLYFIQVDNHEAVAYDYCILAPITKQKRTFPFLKIGNFDKTNEGQEIYTCGYPLGYPQQFISKGIISTKYIDNSIVLIANQNKKIMPRSQALLDLTMNSGNSGGAIIKLGETVNDDKVIGIADFIINPIGGFADQLIQSFDQSSGGVIISGVDPNATFSLFAKLLSQTSIGVSGCVSINYVLDGYNSAIKK